MTEQFETFMRNYQNMVYSTALRLVANTAEAEDISQEVFLKAYERFADLRESPTAGGWLRTVARNMSLNHLSRYRSRWTFFSDLRRSDDQEESPEIEFAAPQDLERELGQADRREVLEKALQKLANELGVPVVACAGKMGFSKGKGKIEAQDEWKYFREICGVSRISFTSSPNRHENSTTN